MSERSNGTGHFVIGAVFGVSLLVAGVMWERSRNDDRPEPAEIAAKAKTQARSTSSTEILTDIPDIPDKPPKRHIVVVPKARPDVVVDRPRTKVPPVDIETPRNDAGPAVQDWPSDEDLKAPLRTWTKRDGTKIEGRYNGYLNKTVMIRKADSKIVTVPLEELSDTDRAMIEKKLGP